jgi:hypothetical protein
VTKYGGVPPYAETQNYVGRVQAFANAYASAAGAAFPTTTPVAAGPAVRTSIPPTTGSASGLGYSTL